MKHKHHIIPKHAGGTDDPSNIVLLTIEEHAKAHKELYKKYSRWQDKIAYEGLSGQIGKEEIIQEIYKNKKTKLGAVLSDETKAKISMAKKGVKHSEEHIAKTRRWGMKQTDYQKQRVRETRQKEYTIYGPKGNKNHIINLLDFCRKNNLDQGNMTKVAQGKLKQHKGYKVSYN